MSPDTGGLLKWKRFADHTTNVLSNPTWGKGKADDNRIRCTVMPGPLGPEHAQVDEQVVSQHHRNKGT